MAKTQKALFVEEAIKRRGGNDVMAKSLTPAMKELGINVFESIQESATRRSLKCQ